MHSLRPALDSRRKAYGSTMTKNQCVEMINYVIFHDPIGGFALGEKTSGSYGTRSDGARCSVDGLIWKADRTFVDGISDAGGASRPAWQVRKVGDINPETGEPYKPFPGALVTAIDPSGGGGQPPQPPAGDLEPRVAALESTIQALSVRVAKLEARTSDHAADIATLRLDVDALQQAPPSGVTPTQVVDIVVAEVGTSSERLALTHAHDLKRKA
jgi:hypothetical protein